MFKKKIKTVLAVMLCAILVSSVCINSYAAYWNVRIVESTTDSKKQNTNYYSMYTSFKKTTGSLWWKKTENYKVYAKFQSAKKIMLANISPTYYWGGPNEDDGILVIGHDSAVTVGKIYSCEIAETLNMKLTILPVEVSASLGGNYTRQTTYTKQEIDSVSRTLTPNNKAGYYALALFVNSDVYNVTVTDEDGKQSTGKAIRFSSDRGYLQVYYSEKDF